MESTAVRRADFGCDADISTHAGVTRVHLVCGTQTTDTAVGLARQWGQDRALCPSTVDRLVLLVEAAVANGLRFDPERVTITLRWLDPDRVRIDAQWNGSSSTATSLPAEYDVESTIATLTVLADEWGFGTAASEPHQWAVLDTR